MFAENNAHLSLCTKTNPHTDDKPHKPTSAGQPSEDVMDLQIVGGKCAVEDVHWPSQAQGELSYQHELATLLVDRNVWSLQLYTCQQQQKMICTVSVSVSAQDVEVALRKTHMHSTPPFSSLPKVALQTVECRPLPFSTPLSFR